MINPPAFGDPDKMTSTLYFGGPQDSHGVHINSGVDNKAAYLIADGGTFNGHNVVGLGLAKTAQIYYTAETTLLGPGSDYLDLFHILPQACTNSVGTAGITAGDCNSVVEAVTATEMDKFPTTAGAHLSAPICDAGAVQTSTLFSDNMEANNGNWTSAATRRDTHSGDTSPGHRRVARSRCMAPTSAARPNVDPDRRVQRCCAIRDDLPAIRPFVRDGLRLAVFFDGGVVEYSTDGGTVWHDAVTLPGPTINGYNGTLRTGFGNPLAGRQAFSGASPGYETTRISLELPRRDKRQASIPSGERQLSRRVGMVHRRSVRVHVRRRPDVAQSSVVVRVVGAGVGCWSRVVGSRRWMVCSMGLGCVVRGR